MPEGGILIHAGDLTHTGTFAELRQAVLWLNSLPHRHKIVIAGNHDVWLENILRNGKEPQVRELFRPILYLRDSDAVIDGLHFWGSPWTPLYAGAFKASREALRANWRTIPAGLDVLITHTPPRGILDREDDESIGCEELALAMKRVCPRVHVFGHAHQGHGHVRIHWDDTKTTDFYNAGKTAYKMSLERDNMVPKKEVRSKD